MYWLRSLKAIKYLQSQLSLNPFISNNVRKFTVSKSMQQTTTSIGFVGRMWYYIQPCLLIKRKYLFAWIIIKRQVFSLFLHDNPNVWSVHDNGRISILYCMIVFFLQSLFFKTYIIDKSIYTVSIFCIIL